MQAVFLHGLGQNSKSWSETIAGMEAGVTPQCPDLSSLLDGEDVTYANLYRALCKDCESFSEPINLCGLSLGAVLALHYAIDHPSRVRSLVLIAPQVKMPKTLLKIQNVIFRFMPDSTFQKMGFAKGDFIRLTRSMADLDFSGGLAAVTCPALVLCGAKDSANRKAAEELAARLPDARMLLIEGAGHEVNVDAPQKLAELLDEFYKMEVRG